MHRFGHVGDACGMTAARLHVDLLVHLAFEGRNAYGAPRINAAVDEDHLRVVILQEIIDLVGNDKAHIIYNPLPIDDPKQRKPDISRAKEILNWQPKVSRKEGLIKSYEYFKHVVVP